eukprot:4860440-Lingulodinium_polyedra.AAC.1
MPQFGRAAAPELRCVLFLAEAQRVPDTGGRLHAELALEGGAWDPHLGPRGAHEAVLEHHPRDGHRCQTAIGQLS